MGGYWQNLAVNFFCGSNSERFGYSYLQSHLIVEDVVSQINSDYDNC